MEDKFAYKPERLPKLLVHNIKRNKMIGVSPFKGVTLDVMTSYYQAVDERDHYAELINGLKLYIDSQMELLTSKMKEAEREKDLTEKKILLIDILELQEDIERLLAFNGGI